MLFRSELEAAGADDVAWRRLLDHLDNDADRLVELIAGMLAKRDQWLHFVVVDDKEALRVNLEKALVAEILAGFVKNYDSTLERGWVAERDGGIIGSVFLVRASADVAKLRLLYVEPAARGLGVGRRLVQECIDFARVKGYKTLTLWTNDVLVSARRIYQAAGFRLTREERHRSFGKELVGQTWDLAL